MDVVMIKNNLLIEIDGSTHFYSKTNHEMAKYKLRKNVLQKCALNMLHLDYHTFEDVEKKQIYKDKIKETVD